MCYLAQDLGIFLVPLRLRRFNIKVHFGKNILAVEGLMVSKVSRSLTLLCTVSFNAVNLDVVVILDDHT